MTWRAIKLPADWNRTRRRILARDNNRCRLCGRWANQVDHIVGAASGGTDDDSNLWTLCKPHHQAKTNAEAAAGRERYREQKTRSPEPHPGVIA